MVMKEQYYTAETLIVQSTKFIEELEEYRARHPWQLHKDKVALLIIDMQDFFLVEDSHAYIPSAKAIIEPIKILQGLFLAHNLPVIQTRHLNNVDNAGNMEKWWGSLLTAEEPLSSITQQLVNPAVHIITKTQPDAFYNSELKELLLDQGITQLLVSGVMTHLCCESTVRSAFMHGFESFFLVDATATYNSDFQRATLLNLAHGYAVPILCGEAIASLGVITNA